MIIYKKIKFSNNLISFLNNLQIFSTSIFCFSIAALPSGNIGNINVKAILAILLVITSLILVPFQKFNREATRVFLVCTAAIIVLGFWLFIGEASNRLYAEQQYRGFVITFSVLGILLFNHIRNIGNSSYIFKTLVAGNLFYCLAKIVIAGLIYFGIISFQRFLEIAGYFGTSPITLEILPRLIRIQTISDVITPFLILIILKGNLKSRKIRYSILMIFIISLFLSYARILWAVTFILLILSLLNMKLNTKKLLVFSAVAILIVAFFALSPPELIYKRFVGADTTLSDQTRKVQIRGLLTYFNEKPLFGHGLGSYVPNLIRDRKAPYNYEVQWVSFLMQLGLIGIVFLLFLVLLGAWYIISQKGQRIWIISYFIWLLMAFTNPYLTSSVSGLVFFILLSLGGESEASLKKPTLLKENEINHA